MLPNNDRVRLGLSVVLCTSIIICFAGCGKTVPGTTVNKVCLGGVDRGRLMEEAEKTLCRMNFDIDKADPDAGYIRTRPLCGAQFFQFWREDNAGKRSSFYSNLHSIRRTAELSLTEQNSTSCLACRVTVERLSLPEVNVTGPSQAGAIFVVGTGTKGRVSMQPEQIQNVEWLTVGNDPNLATVIIQQVEKQITKSGG